MKIARASLVGAAFLLAPIVAGASPTQIVVPAGTAVEVRLADALDSRTVHVGDTFDLRVVHDVIVDKMVVVRNGARGVGHVSAAHAATTHGKSGGMRLSFDYVNSADGSQIPIDHTQTDNAPDRSTAGATALGIFLVGGWGLFFHNFVHGSDVTIPDDVHVGVTTADSRTLTLDSVKDVAPIVTGARAADATK